MGYIKQIADSYEVFNPRLYYSDFIVKKFPAVFARSRVPVPEFRRSGMQTLENAF